MVLPIVQPWQIERIDYCRNRCRIVRNLFQSVWPRKNINPSINITPHSRLM